MKAHLYLSLRKMILLGTCLVLGTAMSFAQRTVTGTIVDNTGEPLIGANVLIKGTSTGTITDIDGNYTLSANDGDILVFSYTGYQGQEVTLSGQSTVNVTLVQGQLLDEVVVIGYGTVKRSDLTGSVASVKEEDFNKGTYTSPDQLIQGKVAGVQMINNSGAPGGEATVRIRGNSSVRTGNQPLYVVDGIPLDGRSVKPDLDNVGGGDGIGDTPGSNPLSFLNPNDIASIEVLKDASASAIYGSRGANGVILITTKKGKLGVPQISFGASVGVSSIMKEIEVLNGDEYRSALQTYDLGTGGDFGGNVDAMDAILRSAITQNYSFSINGGNDKGRYRISAGYLDQEGIVDESGLKKYSGSFNGSYNFLQNDRLTLDVNILASQTLEAIAQVGNNAGFTNGVIGQALAWNPTRPLRLPNGDLDIELGSTTINPVAMIQANKDDAELTSVLGSISPSFKITDNLVYKYLFSINHNVGIRRSQIAPWLNVQNVEGQGWAAFGNNTLTTQQHTHTISYITDLSSAVSLNALVGYEYQKFDYRGMTVTAKDFIDSDIDFNNILENSTQGTREITAFADPISELQSYFGRAIFNVNDKYLVTATIRADGSSKFGENNRYGYFPSFAVAWNVTNEDFLSGGPFDNLKLRASWGQTGNQEFPAGSAQDRYDFTQGSLNLENVANPDLKWETSTTINVGIDFSILDYKLTGTIDYFNKKTEDPLFNFETIQPAPAGRYWVNLDGEVINSGLEVALNAFIVDNADFTWQFGANAAFLHNELQNYVGPGVLTGGLHGQGISGTHVQTLANGQPLNVFYTREWLGIGEDGFDMLTDDGNTFYYVGDPNPGTLLGISTNLTYKNWDLGINMNGAFGHVIYNNTANTSINIGNLGSRNIARDLLDLSPLESNGNSIKASSRYLEKGDYLKMANATLSYSLGDIGTWGKDARLYITGQNLFVLTSFTGFDPEVNTDKNNNDIPSFGIEYQPYPSARTITFGANVTF